MTEVLPGVHADRTEAGVEVEARDPDPFYRLLLDGSIPERDMWFVFTHVAGKVRAKHGLGLNFGTVADPLAWARRWVLIEERL